MKNVIEVMYSRKSRNAEHYQLYSSLLVDFPEELAIKYNLTEPRSVFAASFARENDAYLRNQAFKWTKAISGKNVVCDRLFRSLSLYVQSKQLSSNAEEVKDAEHLLYLMKPYMRVNEKPQAENIAMLKDLVDALESDQYADSVDRLNLTNQVAELKTAVAEFETVYRNRSSEKLARSSSGKMKEIRLVVDQDFAELAKAISALYYVIVSIEKDTAKAAELGEVIDKMNSAIKEFHDTLSRRLSSIPKQKDPDTGGPDNPGEEEPDLPDDAEDDLPVEV